MLDNSILQLAFFCLLCGSAVCDMGKVGKQGNITNRPAVQKSRSGPSGWAKVNFERKQQQQRQADKQTRKEVAKALKTATPSVARVVPTTANVPATSSTLPAPSTPARKEPPPENRSPVLSPVLCQLDVCISAKLFLLLLCLPARAT